MNKEDIIRMAREAGVHAEYTPGMVPLLERFAALVAAAERNRTWTQEHWTEYERNIAAAAKAEENEACAKLAETYREWDDTGMGIAAAIRARKENT